MTDILHFTHLDNVANILTDGGMWSDGHIAQSRARVTRSGNPEIKQRRLATPIEQGFAQGGTVGHYVPFYYAPRSPMLYVISKGRVEGVSPDQDLLVYLVAQAEDFPEGEFVVTDGNAAASLTRHFGSHAALRTEVDWPLMRSVHWNDTDADGDRKRRRSAEFLVHRFVPWERVRRVVTRVAETQAKVMRLYGERSVVHRPPVEVDPGWYY